MKPIKGVEGGTYDIHDIFGKLTSRLYQILNAKNTELIDVRKEGIISDILEHFSSYNPKEVVEEISFIYSKIKEIRFLIQEGKLEIPDTKISDMVDNYFDDHTSLDETKKKEKYLREIAEEIDYYKNELEKIQKFLEKEHDFVIIEKKDLISKMSEKIKWNGQLNTLAFLFKDLFKQLLEMKVKNTGLSFIEYKKKNQFNKFISNAFLNNDGKVISEGSIRRTLTGKNSKYPAGEDEILFEVKPKLKK
jgi:hypothetical protein